MKGVWIGALLGVVLLGGCSNQANDPPALFSIRVSSSVEGSIASRGVVESDALLSRVQFLRRDAMIEPKDLSNPLLVLADRTPWTGDMLFDDPKPMYFATPSSTFLAAYHPQTAIGNNVATWLIDGKTDVLVTPIFNAGTYSAPKTGPMVFKHRLSQLEVICVADPAQEVSEEFLLLLWGKITKIELLDTPSELRYAFSTNTVVGGGDLVVLPLLKSDYDTAFETVAITKNTERSVTAAGMYAPSVTTDPLKIKVYTEKEPLGKLVEVQLTEHQQAKGLEVGKCHKVTLTFMAVGGVIEVLATTIEAWKPGYMGDLVLEK